MDINLGNKGSKAGHRRREFNEASRSFNARTSESVAWLLYKALQSLMMVCFSVLCGIRRPPLGILSRPWLLPVLELLFMDRSLMSTYPSKKSNLIKVEGS